MGGCCCCVSESRELELILDKEQWRTRLVTEYFHRESVGEAKAIEIGHFINREIGSLVHSYLDWVDYPEHDHVLRGHSKWVECAVFSHSGRYLYTGSHDQTIIQWDMCELEIIAQWHAHSSMICALAFHSRGLLASGCGSGKIRVWDAFTHQRYHDINGELGSNSINNNNNNNKIISLDFDPKGQMILSVNLNHELIRVWSSQNGQLIRCFDLLRSSSKINKALFMNSDQIIIANSSLSIWDIKSGECIKIPKYYMNIIKQEIYDFDISLDNNDENDNDNDSGYVVTVQYDKLIVRDLSTLEKIAQFDTHSTQVCFRPGLFNHGWIARDSTTLGIELLNYHTNDREPLFEFNDRIYGNVKSFCFSPDGTRLVSLPSNPTIQLFDLNHRSDRALNPIIK